MTKIQFEIRGNQNDQKGNPISYKRTLSGKFRKDSVDYMEWKEYARSEFDRNSNSCGVAYVPFYTASSMPYPHFEGLVSAEMHIEIFWANGAHGDGDNIFKGIADALFKNDKLITAGSFKSMLSPYKEGKVVVTLELSTA